MNQPYDYLFVAEAMNGNIIKQTPEDKSILKHNKSAFYDVLQNLPLKTFTLVGKGHTFTVDFTDLSLSIDGRKEFCPRPPEGSKITPIYWVDTIQVSKTSMETEVSLLSGLKRKIFSTAAVSEEYSYRIGFQAHYPNPVNGKRNAKFEMTVR